MKTEKIKVMSEREYHDQFFKYIHSLKLAYNDIIGEDWLRKAYGIRKNGSIRSWEQADNIYKNHLVDIKEKPRGFDETLFFVY